MYASLGKWSTRKSEIILPQFIFLFTSVKTFSTTKFYSCLPHYQPQEQNKFTLELCFGIANFNPEENFLKKKSFKEQQEGCSIIQLPLPSKTATALVTHSTGGRLKRTPNSLLLLLLRDGVHSPPLDSGHAL